MYADAALIFMYVYGISIMENAVVKRLLASGQLCVPYPIFIHRVSFLLYDVPTYLLSQAVDRRGERSIKKSSPLPLVSRIRLHYY